MSAERAFIDGRPIRQFVCFKSFWKPRCIDMHIAATYERRAVSTQARES